MLITRMQPGLGRGVSARCWAAGGGWGWGRVWAAGASAQLRERTRLRKSGGRSERDVIEVKCKQLCRERLHSARAASFQSLEGREGGDRVQHLPCSIYLQTLAIS